MDVNNVSDEFAADCLFSGLQGIKYWCEVVSYTMTSDTEYSRVEILEMPEKDDASKHHTVTLDTIRKGIKMMMGELPGDKDKPNISLMVANFWQLRAWLEMSLQDDSAYMVDSDVGDALIQLGVLGEMKYII